MIFEQSEIDVNILVSRLDILFGKVACKVRFTFILN